MAGADCTGHRHNQISIDFEDENSLKQKNVEPDFRINNIPSQELISRWDRCRTLLQRFSPQSQGILLFSRLNIYYFSGSFASGILWLPLEGDPILLCRRGIERAKIESPLQHIYSFSSYGDIHTILEDLGHPLPDLVAAEMNGLSWALSKSRNSSQGM